MKELYESSKKESSTLVEKKIDEILTHLCHLPL
jgi:hypothetical protein